MTLNIGVDVGNSDTKTENTTTPSGFSVRGLLPYGADDYIKFGKNYYIPDEEARFPYKKDKTVDDNMFILTLFAIAKEAIYDISKNLGVDSKDVIQRKIDDLNVINLGIGLPPAHCSTLGKKSVAYYIDHFGDGVSFSYKGLKFDIRLGRCSFFPQDWAAIVTYKTNDESVTKKFASFYAVDIGGYTVDVVPIMNHRPVATRCVSLEMGVLRMFSEMSKILEQDYGKTVRPDIIETVLRDEPTILPEEVQDRIKRGAGEWSDDIIRSLVEADVLFDSYPVVFIGGGSQTFKPYIEKNQSVQVCEFIPGANINAAGYTKLLFLQEEQDR